ncbi:MAG: c-type cytochrome [Novosphingobium sp.]
MQDRFNTIAGWTLFAGIVALGLTSLSGHYFRADKHNRPEKMGFAIAGVVEEGEGGEAAVPLETLLASADAAKGEKSFAKCKSCHTIASGGANGTGPNLFGVAGKPIGSHAAGFAYSADLKAHGGNWDFATLDAWLKNPKAVVPKTAMNFPGLPDAAERANVLAFMNSQGSNLPLPAAPAAAPAEGAAPAEAPAEPAKK